MHKGVLYHYTNLIVNNPPLKNAGLLQCRMKNSQAKAFSTL
jgi:hypothetical protein